jgi:hypothetical protein
MTGPEPGCGRPVRAHHARALPARGRARAGRCSLVLGQRDLLRAGVFLVALPAGRGWLVVPHPLPAGLLPRPRPAAGRGRPHPTVRSR